MKFNQKIAALIAIIISVSIFSMPILAIDQPYMEAAKKDLDSAMKYLKKADADKGGHRQKAMDLTAEAIKSVKDGIAYDKKNPNNRPGRNSNFDENNLVTNNASDQPNMVKAKEYLQAALNNLQKATNDKGGFRVKAMAQVREAIVAVNAGIAYDRNH